MDFQILLFYKYVHIADPEALRDQQWQLCERLGLKGRLIVSAEGINVTLEGELGNTEKYISEITKDPRFADIHFKRSPGIGDAFPKLSVKVRPEIVSLHLGDADLDPAKFTAKHLSVDELHQWFQSGEEFYIVDMRNDYEHKSGYFRDSILAPLSNFRDLPEKINDLAHLKHKKVLTVCTGGVRCEKASGFLLESGFTDVYQLYGGIVTYMEKYPNQDFLGKLYVFDKRILMGFNTDSPEHVVIGKCDLCGKTSENYVNCANQSCHKHFICCEDCLVDGEAFCSEECSTRIEVQTHAKFSA